MTPAVQLGRAAQGIERIPLASPPKKLAVAGGEVHLFCASLDLPSARLNQLAETLSRDERAHVRRLVFQSDSDQFVARRGILREILGWLLWKRPENLAFSYSDRGKPRLAGPAQGQVLHFNLACSGPLAVYVVSHQFEVGIDVERIRPIPEANEIVRRFFSEREAAQWRSLPVDRQLDFFFKCWTSKEAYLKATGKGITGPLKEVEVIPVSDDGTTSANGDAVVRISSTWLLRSLRPVPDYACAVVTNNRDQHLVKWCWRKSGTRGTGCNDDL